MNSEYDSIADGNNLHAKKSRSERDYPNDRAAGETISGEYDKEQKKYSAP